MSVRVITQANPFKIERTIKTYDTTQYSIYDLYMQEQIDVPIEHCIVYLNDILVTDNYHNIKPFVGDTVYFKVIPAGEREDWEAGGAFSGAAMGGYAGMKIGGLIGSIFGPVGTGVGTALGFVIGFAGGAIFGSTGAGAAYDFLFAGTLDPIDPTYTFDGKTNSGEQYKTVPVVYGTTKMTPSFGGNDYTELVGSGDDAVQYLHQLYVLGYQPTIVNNVKIGDSLLFERVYNTISAVIDGATNTITSTGAFASDDYKVGMPILLENSINYGEYTITSVTDDVLTVSEPLSNESATITLSYLQLTDIYNDVQVMFTYDGDLSDSYYPYQTTEATLDKLCSYNIPQYYTTPDNVKEIDIELTFPSGLGLIESDTVKDHSVEYLIEARNVDSDTWVTLQEKTTVTGNTRNFYRFEKHFTFGSYAGLDSIGQYVIRITKISKDADNSAILDRFVWHIARTHTVDATTGEYIAPVAESVAKDNLLLMSLRIKATDQLSGSINNLTCNVTRWVKDYDATTGEWVVRESHNPAAMYVDVLTNDKLAQTPIPFTDEYFDMDALISFYEWCDGGNTDYTDPDTGEVSAVYYNCDGLCNIESTVEREINAILACGRAQYAIVDGKYTILHDIIQTTPVQMFTPRNMLADSYSSVRTFDYIPNKYNVQFINADVDYILEEIDVTTGSADIEKSIRFTYVSNYKQAYALGKYFLNASQIRVVSYQFKTSVDALVATRGDRILIQHDASLLGISAGRVTAVTTDAGLITSITLDENCPMEAGNSYGITVRDDTISSYGVDTIEGDNTTLILSESVPEGSILVGDLVAFGLTDKITEDAIIIDITYDSYMNATIKCAVYDDAVYDLGATPAWTSNITKLGSEKPEVNVSTYGDIDSTLQHIIDVQNNPALTIFQKQPVPPYNVGDIWFNNTAIYDCVVARTSDESFVQSDWRLRSSSTFDVLNKDTFNIPTPEHRWQQIPGNGVIYNLLATTTYDVTSGDSTKEKVLVDDGDDWIADSYLEAITVEATSAKQIIVDSNANDIHVVGRYENSGYMGEAYTNLLVNPETPISQSVTLSAGHTVIQCYRGTIACNYGTASYGNPLEFDSVGETLSLTISGDCKFGQVTQTAFIPPYVNGSFTTHFDTQSISGTSLQIVTKITNVADSATYGLVQAYGDTSNNVGIVIHENAFYVKGNVGTTIFYYRIGDCYKNTYIISLDWSSGISVTIDGIPLSGYRTDTYGYDIDENYGWDSDEYGFDNTIETIEVPLTTAYIGKVDSD